MSILLVAASGILGRRTKIWGTNVTDQRYVGAINSGMRFAGPPAQYGVRVLKLF